MSDANIRYLVRRSADRGFFDHGWLKTYHTFSFAGYYDADFMGFRTLRVINEDTVAPGEGFGTHGHEDMEIITVVLAGAVAHKDSMGNEHILGANEIQSMSAGTGVHHSEYNPSQTEPVHFLQIWIMPDTQGVKPRYQEKKLPLTQNEWVLLVSPTGQDDSLLIQQDIKLYMLTLTATHTIERQLEAGRYAWLQVLEGEVTFAEQTLFAGDGAAFDAGTTLTLTAGEQAKLLFFDLN